MGRKAKLKRQRKQNAAAEAQMPATQPASDGSSDRTDDADRDDRAGQAVPISRDFINRMERQGYSLKADNRAPEIPSDERPQPERR